LQIAAKPLQMETWLLLTAYKKSPSPYPMVRSQTPYDLPFSYNTARMTYHSAFLIMTLQNHLRSMILMCSKRAYATSF